MPQRMRMQLSALFAVALLTACAATRQGVSREGAVLVVDNRSFTDMTVYVVEGSSRRRLGFAPGNKETELAIPYTLVNRELQFLADPLGSNRTSVSNRLFVVPGQVVTLTIPP